MSKNPVLESIDQYYEQIFIVRGWKVYKPDNLTTQNKPNQYLVSKSTIIFMNRVDLFFDLTLKVEETSSVVVVDSASFSIETGNGAAEKILLMREFAEYQGLQFKAGTYEVDKPITGELFKITAPRSLVAFLNLYDETAKSLGKTQLFQI